jgi:hypothetical protein
VFWLVVLFIVALSFAIHQNKRLSLLIESVVVERPTYLLMRVQLSSFRPFGSIRRNGPPLSSVLFPKNSHPYISFKYTADRHYHRCFSFFGFCRIISWDIQTDQNVEPTISHIIEGASVI